MIMGNASSKRIVRRRTSHGDYGRAVRYSIGIWSSDGAVYPIVLCAGLAAVIAGCVYDADDRCGPGQLLYDESRCICAEGAVLTAQGCVPCAENEVVGGSACVCAEGFWRPTADTTCQAVPSALGVACDVTGAPCSDPSYNLCFAATGTAGYCTSECTTSEECAGGYVCDAVAAPPYCRRPPTGFGRACATDADCASTEATYCESSTLYQCVVRDCSPANQDCFPGTQCCDLSQFGVPAPLCLPNGAC
jgi:hypothetical protein